MLGIMASTNVALAWEFTPGQICQVTPTTADHANLTLNYGWVTASAITNTSTDTVYTVCPVPRTYSSVSTATAYVYNPSGATTGGYINYVSTDTSVTSFHYASTTTAGYTSIAFAPPDSAGTNGFLNFELWLPAGGGVVGFHTN
jgi:hypothetical protein